MIDKISSEKVYSILDDRIIDKLKVEVFEKTESTNTLLRQFAQEGADEGLVLIAGEQTAGRGRMGRSFFSPGDTGVYMSVLLKPDIKPEDAVQITTAAAVSVCEALEKLGVENTGIKWVNDIFVENKKVCGILTESSFDSVKGVLEFAVLGIGINVYEPKGGFPEDIKNIAGSVFKTEKPGLRNEIVAHFLNSFFDFYNCISEKKHLEEYRSRSFVIGKDITVLSNGDSVNAKAIGIDDNCNLIAQFSDGSVKNLYSGEISVRLV